MKKLIQILSFLSLSFALVAQPIPFVKSYDLSEHTGQSYLSFMENEVKPAMDALATDGYLVKGADAVALAFDESDTKVQRKVRSWGGLENVQAIATALEGETVTLETLPGKIKAIDRSVDAYDLSTFLGLASGGGVSIKYFDDNYALNVHYDTKEERSGRSFGVGPTRKANDASDKNYLQDVQSYANHEAANMKEFYKALFETLLNSDPSNYVAVEPEGQTVLTDFLAVFTAEQARNLMDGEVRPHWDAALLEVTLLASFHAGQEEFKLFYKNPGTQETTFTNKTLQQKPCEVSTREQKASMVDYWQFSRNITSPEHCRRSGINITKSEFRKLEKEITKYIALEAPELNADIENAMGLTRSSSNLFETLSKYLISTNSERSLNQEKVEAITKAWVNFLEFSRKHANEISLQIEENE